MWKTNQFNRAGIAHYYYSKSKHERWSLALCGREDYDPDMQPEVEALRAFKSVVQTLGVFSLCLLGVALVFTWAERDRTAAAGRGA